MPSLNPDIGADAQRAEDARRAAAEEAARQRAEEAKRLAEANAKAAAPPIVPADRPPTDPKERITRFVNGYDGGDCFFITPIAVADGSATLEGYGVTAAPFEVLDYEFKRTNGFEATVGYYAITQPQCPAITFLSRLRNQRGPAPLLDVSAGNLRSSGYVSGFVSNIAGRNVELLMIDHEGIVLSLTNLLKDGGGDTRNFTINIRRADDGPPKLQLVFALASAKPLQALRPRQQGSAEIGTADRVFAAVSDEAQQTGQTLNTSAKSFNLEK
jgi:serine/threonine-protein kinase